MKSSSPADQTERQLEDKGMSFAKLFNLLLLGFLAIQVTIGVIIIVRFIGGEMKRMQLESVKVQLEGREHALENYLNDRLALLEDYAKLPVFVAGVMNPFAQRADVVDFIDALTMLKEEAYFCLQDYDGNPIYSDAKTAIYLLKGQDFTDLVEQKKRFMVDIVMFAKSGPGSSFWRLSVPVNYNGLPEGVLTAYIPVSKEALPIAGNEMTRLSIITDGGSIISHGSVQEPALTLRVKTRFPGIELRQSVSRQVIEKRVEYLVSILIIALIIGTVTLSAVIQLVGRQILIVPHAKLQAISKALEQEVEKQTADLKMRTAQLSVENRERREAEAAAQEAEQLVTTLLEGIGAAFFIIDPDTGHIINHNDRALSMLNIVPGKLAWDSCRELFEGLPGGMPDLLCPENADQDPFVEGVIHGKDGHTFPIARHLVSVEVGGRKHIGVILFDITERKNLERRLSIAQKLESIGELASGIAHEINTPVQYIGDSVHFVQEAFEDVAAVMETKDELVRQCRDEGSHGDLLKTIEETSDDADLEFVMRELPKACARALDGTDRVATIVRAMKQFSHPGSEGKTAVDLNQSLENTITVAKNEWKYVAEIETDFEPLPPVPCLAGDINQVFLNILVNAAHAIEDVVGNSGEKGTIRISTRNGARFVTISISDTGCGIAPENRDKIFDPFFTTKDVGKGTGQGLAIAHDIIVERHGGSIDVRSKPGEGSTFIISLPY